jgi:hypothetical protein
VNVPTLITTYSEFKAKFGATFVSGGTTYDYLTSQAAYNYFQQGGTSLLVTRVASGSYTAATASVLAMNSASLGNAFTLSTLSVGTVMNNDANATDGKFLKLIQDLDYLHYWLDKVVITLQIRVY